MPPLRKLNTGLKELREYGSRREMKIQTSSIKYELPEEEEAKYQVFMTRRAKITAIIKTSKRPLYVISKTYTPPPIG